MQISLLIQTRQDHFFTGERKIRLSIQVKNKLMDLFLTNMQLWASQDVKLMDWSGVDHCDVFIRCLDSHSDGTHSL